MDKARAAVVAQLEAEIRRLEEEARVLRDALNVLRPTERPAPDDTPIRKPQLKPKDGQGRARSTASLKYDWVKGRKLWDEGRSALEIARELGCSDKAIYYRAKQDGWPARNGPRQNSKPNGPSSKATSSVDKRPRIPMQQCSNCGTMTNVNPCEKCHIFIPGAKRK